MKKKILLVEDDPIIALCEKRMIEGFGYLVETVSDGESAVARYAADPSVDLVLMDIDLGKGMDGTQAAALLLASRDVPIVFLSSHDEVAIVEKTEGITSYGYITKNSNKTILDASIKMAFKLFDANAKTLAINRKLEATLEALPDLYFEVDRQGRYLDYHSYDPALLYKKPSLLMGSTISEQLPPIVSQAIMTAIEEAMADGVSRGCRYSLDVLAGLRWFEVFVSKMAGEPDDPRFILICRDISAGVRAEEALNASRLHAERLLGVSAEIIMATDLNGKITLMNESGHRLLGYEQGELLGKKWADCCLTDENRLDVATFLEGIMCGEESTLIPHENLVRLKNGETRSILWHNTVLRDDNKRITGIMSSGEDVSEYRALEERLRQSESRYRSILDASPDTIALTDIQGQILMFLPKALPMFGYDRSDIQSGHSISEYIVPEDRPRAMANLGRMLKGERLGSEQYRGLKKDGNIFDIEINGEILKDAGGKPEQVLFIVRDISERMRLVRRYKLLFDLSTLGIALIDVKSGKYIDANPAFVRMLGYDKSELLTMRSVDITPPEQFRPLLDIYREYEASGWIAPYTKEFRRKDGSLVPVSVNTTAFVNDDKRRVIWSVFEDISARRESEKKVSTLLSEKEMILKEVHHRIKNNFAVIQSLLNLSIRPGMEEQVLNAFSATAGRVHSMAILYEKLYESTGFLEASLRDYLSTLLDEVISNFPNAAKVRSRKDLDDFSLPAKQLQSLGILVNELVTNSMKHAFNGREEGQIHVSATRGNGRIRVIVSDDGVGLPATMDVSTSSGFGLTLVSMLVSQLGGTMSMEADGGTKTIVEFEG